KRPEQGHTTEEVLANIRELGGDEVADYFWKLISTTQDLDIETPLKEIGLEFVWTEEESAWLGAGLEGLPNQLRVKQILLDSPAYKGGLNAGDEILALNGLRVTNADQSQLDNYLAVDQKAELLVSRLGK